ncbi:hypothetical protein K437DRAFT_225656 [Tilletiaria anomala UBC 951]|uniref:Protein ROT1 n=1 Tax=Tilletiaria anomala (strain ATCC 24038 / CBS 436.72 / UBC 951) TaxID=1037660 RepID=A0A066VNJ7_TILAU|nr:uncharacterized protein K437DRAFT_225656 [Tilletiaria anomala UBC 951]KDN43317.1 hypothetical protein K437DRAFT_225656 [Tilletiaria anomala UBC 951]
MTLLLVPTLLSSLLLLPTLLLTLIALTPVPAQAQLPTGTNIGQQNNVTSLRGTWSSGSGNVVTGLQFFNPANNTFTYPTTAGMSYSFTDDFHWEQALYIYQPKADNPYCVTAQLIWQHGTYSINGSNFISLQPFKGDGMQQIASRCTKTSQSVQPYNQPELMSGFEIHLDTHYGQSAYYLKMYGFDGTPKPLMWKVYDPPQMLPTVQLKEQVRRILLFSP